jgi:hypothetical protein
MSPIKAFFTKFLVVGELRTHERTYARMHKGTLTHTKSQKHARAQTYTKVECQFRYTRALENTRHDSSVVGSERGRNIVNSSYNMKH